MNTQTNNDFLKNMITHRLELEAEKLIKEAQKDLEKKAPEIVAGVIVDLMSIAEMQTLSDRIIFTIRKKQ